MSSLKVRLKKKDERRNYLLDEININDLMSEKYKKTGKYLNYIEHLIILVSTVIPELHLKQLGFTYITCGSFTKHRERIKKIRETSTLKHLNRNELDKACLANDAVYYDNKDLAKRNISERILKYRVHESPRNCNYDGYQKALGSIVYKFFDKKTGSRMSVNV